MSTDKHFFGEANNDLIGLLKRYQDEGHHIVVTNGANVALKPAFADNFKRVNELVFDAGTVATAAANDGYIDPDKVIKLNLVNAVGGAYDRQQNEAGKPITRNYGSDEEFYAAVTEVMPEGNSIVATFEEETPHEVFEAMAEAGIRLNLVKIGYADKEAEMDDAAAMGTGEIVGAEFAASVTSLPNEVISNQVGIDDIRLETAGVGSNGRKIYVGNMAPEKAQNVGEERHGANVTRSVADAKKAMGKSIDD